MKKWFIPHPENDHKPHILRPRIIAVVCALAIAAEFLFFSSFSMPAFRSPLLGDIMVSVLADGTNSARVTNGLPSLQVNLLLTAAAQQKVNDMVANHYFDHTSPEGITPWYWFGNVGYDFTYAGENLAVNFSDSQDVTNAWLNSPEHRANIMNANFTQFGIAIATGTFEGQPAVYVAEEFGAPSPFMAAGSGATPKLVLATNPAAGKSAAAGVAPIVIAASSSQTSSSEQTFVAAVRGAETGTVPGVTPATMQTPQFVPQTNIVQQTVVNPRTALNRILLFVAILFAFALLINIFVRIRIQHPNIILGGLIVISLAGIFIILNQHLFLSVVVK